MSLDVWPSHSSAILNQKMICWYLLTPAKMMIRGQHSNEPGVRKVHVLRQNYSRRGMHCGHRLKCCGVKLPRTFMKGLSIN